MADLTLTQNPFKVFTPEGMSAKDAWELFVPVADFGKISDGGHAMINGPRGCGKSMIFRFLQPDCQMIDRNCKLSELPFFAVPVPIKNTAPNLTEFQRLEDQYAKLILNEHVLVCYVLTRVFDSLATHFADHSGDSQPVMKWYYESFMPRLKSTGWSDEAIKPTADASYSEVFANAKRVTEDIYRSINTYARRLSFTHASNVPYTGPLCDYLNFLHPLLSDLLTIEGLPNGPFYLLVDDADYLNLPQTRILNSWVATRTHQQVSLKISTQLRYKTYSTVAGIPIQCPHDYQEINVADIYTSIRSNYLQKVESIVSKRLKKGGIEVEPRDFFPPDLKQEEAIKTIEKAIKEKWETSGKGFRPDDDVSRYARPEFIKSLGGQSKSTSKFSYAGFEQLVHISSGLIRYFLEPAAQMFDEERARSKGKPVLSISPGLQDQVVRREAENLMFNEFDKIAKEDPTQDVGGLLATSANEHKLRTEQLRNLIRSLGGTFYQKLISEDSERRVFSVAISGSPVPEVLDVFELGVRYGYFHRSSIGNKDGTGRTRLYVLTRRLAPHFNLDPSRFSGYLWLTSELLLQGMQNPDRILRRIKTEGLESVAESVQQPLFE